VVFHCFSWATCLNDAPTKTRPDLDHEARFQDEPGQSWGAKRQCEVLLHDKDATLLNPDKLQANIIVSLLSSCTWLLTTFLYAFLQFSYMNKSDSLFVWFLVVSLWKIIMPVSGNANVSCHECHVHINVQHILYRKSLSSLCLVACWYFK
jgi:hypothetical protein